MVTRFCDEQRPSLSCSRSRLGPWLISRTRNRMRPRFVRRRVKVSSRIEARVAPGLLVLMPPDSLVSLATHSLRSCALFHPSGRVEHTREHTRALVKRREAPLSLTASARVAPAGCYLNTALPRVGVSDRMAQSSGKRPKRRSAIESRHSLRSGRRS